LKLQDIWTPCGGKSNCRSLKLTPWRIVEAQHVTSTRTLVDSDEEQQILEEEIDRVKPPLPEGAEFRGMHYLLFTPFRYPPLRRGSRFGTRQERSIWYGSEEIMTAQAEVAYYRLLFFAGSSAVFENTELRLTAFTVSVSSKTGIDLTAIPFSKFEKHISSKTDYTSSQKLGLEMRNDSVEVFRYVSARDRKKGINVALFTPIAFSSKSPIVSQTWICIAGSNRVEFARSDLLVKEHQVFEKTDFEVGGKLPAPAL
jgi:hypothetical protein